MIHLRLPFVKSLVQSYGETDRHIGRKKKQKNKREKERACTRFTKSAQWANFNVLNVYTHKLTDTVMRNLY